MIEIEYKYQSSKMSFIIIHGRCGEVGILSIYPDTEEGQESAVRDMRRHALAAFEKTDLIGEVEDISMKRVTLPSVIENVFEEDREDNGEVIMTVKTLIRKYDDVREAYKKVYRNYKIEERRRDLSEERRLRYEKEEEEEEDIDVDEIDREIDEEIGEDSEYDDDEESE